jgi:serine/threonine protein phosphatase PrpC
MLWVGQFGVVNGEAKEESPWVGAFPDRSGDEDAADVYLVVEPALPGSDEFCEELKRAVGEVFLKSKVSLTGGILRALKAAHEDLREWNRRSIKDHRVAAGVSCVAVRRDGESGTDEAYLAQVGPSVAVLYHGGFAQYLAPSMPEATDPLGLNETFWPEFTRLDLDEGDRLLLVSPSLAASVPEVELSAALDLDPEDVLPALYRLSREHENCGALLVAGVPAHVTSVSS